MTRRNAFVREKIRSRPRFPVPAGMRGSTKLTSRVRPAFLSTFGEKPGGTIALAIRKRHWARPPSVDERDEIELPRKEIEN